MTNHTTRLARISADMGLSIDEAEDLVNSGQVLFDTETQKFHKQLARKKQAKQHLKHLRQAYGRLDKAELRWLTK